VVDDFFNLPWHQQLGVVASVVAIAGIPLTFIRTWRTASAVKETELRLARYQLFTLLSGVRQLERDLDSALQGGQRQDVTDAILAFKVIGNRLQALLGPTDADELELRSLLSAAVVVATDAKDVVVDIKKHTAEQYRADLREATRPLAKAITAAADKADEVGMRIAVNVPRS
jgi:hypothetical protein